MMSDHHLLESLGSVTLLKISGTFSYKNGVNERLSKYSPRVTQAKIRMCSTNERHSHEDFLSWSNSNPPCPRDRLPHLWFLGGMELLCCLSGNICNIWRSDCHDWCGINWASSPDSKWYLVQKCPRCQC